MSEKQLEDRLASEGLFIYGKLSHTWYYAYSGGVLCLIPSEGTNFFQLTNDITFGMIYRSQTNG